MQELHILSKHCDISAFRVFDELENVLPAGAMLRFSNGANVAQVHPGDRKARYRFRNNAKKRLSILTEQLQNLRIPLTDVDCQENLGAPGRVSTEPHSLGKETGQSRNGR